MRTARLVRAASLALALMMVHALAVLADSPAPTQAAAGDPRSVGQGPGLVGDPLAAIVIVAAIALLSILATLLYVRATGGNRDDAGGR